jgi:predicted outer membrane repeat protein
MRKLLIILIPAFFVVSASAATIYIDANGTGDYPTIQEAINDANDGDVIILEIGTYTGTGNRDIDFLGKAITVRSTDPNDWSVVEATVIDCNGTESEPCRGFNFHNYEDANSVVMGLTIRNGYGQNEQIGSYTTAAGGGFFCVSSSPTISMCTITSNAASSGGGILCYDYSSPRITSCSFIANQAYNGGGIYCLNNSSPTIRECIVSDNSAPWNRGAGIYCSDDCNLTITHCYISGNGTSEATAAGGGICCLFSNMMVENCKITENKADSGGGIYLQSSNVTITNCIISNNMARYYGGGIECWNDCSGIISSCVVSGNVAYDDGGGISCDQTRSSPLIITNNQIVFNRARSAGGGIELWHSNPIIKNCIIAGNSAPNFRSGGVDCCDGSPTMINCSVIGNYSGNEGGGICCWIHSRPIISNCILFDNVSKRGSQIAMTTSLFPQHPSSLEISFSNIQGGKDSIYIDPNCELFWYSGNINMEPCFVASGFWDANGTPTDANDDFWVDGDYHPLPFSLCINAGDPNYIPEPNETDLDGLPRVIGGRIDMGCYESDALPVNLRIAPRVVNIRSRGRFIMAFMTMPEGITLDDINDAEPLLFMPGRIEATRQCVWQSHNWRRQRTYIMAIFDKSDCMAYLSPGRNEVNVIGQLSIGRFFYGTDGLRVIQWRPWLWRYHRR